MKTNISINLLIISLLSFFSEEVHLKFKISENPLTSDNSTLNANNEPITTQPCGDNKNSTNTIGHVGKKELAINTRPYKVESCDQVMIIKGKTLFDEDDFLTRKDSYFTMSMYLINLLGGPSPSTLKNSINLQLISEFPSILYGSKSCVKFVDNIYNSRIILCAGSYDEALEIIEVYNSFLKCRRGSSPDPNIKPSNSICNEGESTLIGKIKNLNREKYSEIKAYGLAYFNKHKNDPK